MCRTFSDEKLAQLAALAAMRNEDIDIIDIPELPPENWARSRRALQRQADHDAVIQLDPDVAQWLRGDGSDSLQDKVSRLLRSVMRRDLRRRSRQVAEPDLVGLESTRYR